MHWTGSLQSGWWLPGGQALPPHRGEGSTRCPGWTAAVGPARALRGRFGNLDAPGQRCCMGQSVQPRPLQAPDLGMLQRRGTAGVLPWVSKSSSSPQTWCLSHQPNAATPAWLRGRPMGCKHAHMGLFQHLQILASFFVSLCFLRRQKAT